MEDIGVEMERFFEAYARNANLGDSAGTVGLFAAEFMAADPSGARVVSAEGLGMGVAKRKKLFEGLGSRATRLVSLKTTALNERYCLAETEWAVEFYREDVREVLLRSWFVLHQSEAGLKIVFYLADENVMEVLRVRGILAEVRGL
jgi:hypothetical protein